MHALLLGTQYYTHADLQQTLLCLYLSPGLLLFYDCPIVNK